MRVILHIGTDKTGSTSIQQHLLLNRDWLRTHLVFVPLADFDWRGDHASLLDGFADDQVDTLHSELAEASKNGFAIALLTWEGMNFYSLKEIQRLRSVLAGYEISVLVYLREQADIIQTGLLQQFKSRSADVSFNMLERPASIYEKVRRLHFLQHPARNYYRLIQRWSHGMPAAKLLIRIYESEKLLNGSVVDDFFAQLGLAIDRDFVLLPRHSNPSLDVESAILVDRWRCEHLPEDDQRRFIDIALSIIAEKGGGAKYFLQDKSVAAIRRHFHASNKKLARHFLTDKVVPFSMKCVSRSERTIDDILERADELECGIAAIDVTPTLWPLGRETDIHEGVDLSEGWYKRESWGVWSNGSVSKIRFRVWRNFIGPMCVGIRVVIRGRYFGENVSTSIEINGEAYDSEVLDAKHPGLELSTDNLLPYEVVDITLRHQCPMSPAQFNGKNDSRALAFGLTRLGYVYMRREFSS